MAFTGFGVGQLSRLESITLESSTYTFSSTQLLTESVEMTIDPNESSHIVLHDGTRLNWNARSFSADVRARVILTTTTAALFKRLTGTTDYSRNASNDIVAYALDEDNDTSDDLFRVVKGAGSCLIYCDGTITLEGGAMAYDVVIKMDKVTIS